MNISQRLSVTLLGLLFAILPAFAHHSISAKFSPSKEFTVTGLLTRVEWTNPRMGSGDVHQALGADSASPDSSPFG